MLMSNLQINYRYTNRRLTRNLKPLPHQEESISGHVYMIQTKSAKSCK